MNSLIKFTLKPTGVPVKFQKYSGDEDTYITFFTYLEQGEEYADDEEVETGYYIQIDVWSKKNYINLVKQVKTLMKQAGFIRRTENEFYESDTNIYHKVIRFFYIKKQGVIE